MKGWGKLSDMLVLICKEGNDGDDFIEEEEGGCIARLCIICAEDQQYGRKVSHCTFPAHPTEPKIKGHDRKNVQHASEAQLGHEDVTFLNQDSVGHHCC